MSIKQVETSDKSKEQKPILNINLPAPRTGSPDEPLSIGRHNAAAQNNFKQVANILLTIINNQKIVGLIITKQDKEIKELKKNIKLISENIRKLLENKNGKQNKKK